jgi:hypothetical protein
MDEPRRPRLEGAPNNRRGQMRLFHFSEDPTIARFAPRPVKVPSVRPPGREWLNGPLVWAIDDVHQPMYLFPRDCPRILLWPTERTTPQDRERWEVGGDGRRMAVYIEEAWRERVEAGVIHRYEMPAERFESLDDAGMWISRETVDPISVQAIGDLPRALAAQGADLRVVPTLTPLRGVWDSTLHASGIRLRNAQGWDAA